MRRFLARFGLCAALATGVWPFGAIPAAADTEWYDCYAPGVYWRFSGGIWRYGFHDRPLAGASRRNRSPYDPPLGCGAFPSEDGSHSRDRFDRPFGEARRDPRLSDQRSEHIRACMLRYRTYDSRSDTFVGRDKRRHPCRL